MLSPQKLPESSSQSRPISNNEGIGQSQKTPNRGNGSENLCEKRGRGRPRKIKTAKLPTSDDQQDYQGLVSQKKEEKDFKEEIAIKRGGSPIRPKFTKIVF